MKSELIEYLKISAILNLILIWPFYILLFFIINYSIHKTNIDIIILICHLAFSTEIGFTLWNEAIDNWGVPLAKLVSAAIQLNTINTEIARTIGAPLLIKSRPI